MTTAPTPIRKRVAVTRFTFRLRVIKWAMAAMALVGVWTLAVSVGPRLEQTFLPVFDARILDLHDDGVRVRFALAGEKFRSCFRSSYNVFWEVGGIYMPTGLANEDGTPARLPSVPVGVRVALGPYWVPAGSSLRLGTDVNLVLSFYYDCHPFWPVEQQISIPVKFVSRTSYQRPLRHPLPPGVRSGMLIR